MRRFYLENEYGQRISMQKDNENRTMLQQDAPFLSAVSGFGVNEEREYEETKYGFFAATKEVFTQPQISGVFLFRPLEPYAKYRNVTDWMIAAEKLKLVYIPYGKTEYCMDVKIDAIEKSEIAQWGALEVPIKLSGMTPWYYRNPLNIIITKPTGAGMKRYSYRYTYIYSAMSRPGAIEIDPIDGHFPAELDFEIAGPLSAPLFTVENTQTKEIYGKLDLSAVTINAGEKLKYSSREIEAGVWRILADGSSESLTDYVELSVGMQTYFQIPVGKPITLTLSTQSAIEAAAYVCIYRYFKTR
ncbi:MAG: hypothetical protein RR193_05425 [Christensenellaceae bacterium]